MANEQSKIWSNATFNDGVRQDLIEKVKAEESLITWESGEFGSSEILFGQPDVESLMASQSVRWIHLDSAGYERYDREDLREHLLRRGIVMTNSSSVYAQPCAEHTAAMIYSLARQLPGSLDAQRGDRSWQMAPLRAKSRLLAGQSVLILGYGAIGQVLAGLLAPLGMKITGYRRHSDGSEPISMVSQSGVSRVLAEADHVVNILPASPATRRFCGQSFFAGMKAGAIFYNIGRGSTVDQDSLMAALASGLLGGAYLDVTDPEPLPPDHPLWFAPNCLITPHTAGGHALEKERIIAHLLGNLRKWRSGDQLRDRILGV